MAKATTKTAEIAKEVTAQKKNEAQADTTMEFVNKLINKGEEVKPAPQKVEVTVNDKKLKLACRIIPDNCTDTYTNSFTVPVEEKDVKVFYGKGGGVLSASLYVDGKLEYSGVSMQGIFAIVQALFEVDKLTTDRLYIASNVNRKKPPQANKAIESASTENQ